MVITRVNSKNDVKIVFKNPGCAETEYVKKNHQCDLGTTCESHRMISNIKRTDWNTYAKHLSNNMAHLEGCNDIKNKPELEAIVKDFSREIIGAYETSYLFKMVT